MRTLAQVELSEFIITPDEAVTLAGLFKLRVARTPDAVAYGQYDEHCNEWQSIRWGALGQQVGHWQQAMLRSGLVDGQRVGLMLKNSKEWVIFDQAALGLGLVTVPLYMEDRPDNVAYIAADADIKLLLLQGREQWQPLLAGGHDLPGVLRLISLEPLTAADKALDSRLISLDDWLAGQQGGLITRPLSAQHLASIVYTSGTTGKPKGVMLTHRNIINNVWGCVRCLLIKPSDVFLSFLPLSHTFERTVSYYLAMMAGSTLKFTRSIAKLADDLKIIKPTILISVPRIYERIYGKIMADLKEKSPLARGLFHLTIATGWRRFEYQQKRLSWFPQLLLWPLLQRLVCQKVMQAMGGRLRFSICGGAPLPENISRMFIGLGLPLLQGYGLTEASPVVSVNRLESNIPVSIGLPLPEVEVRIGEDSELQTRSESVMQGYLNNETATRGCFTADGWLRTGDKARIDDQGHIYITGRIKEILVLGNGEKIPPADMEMAILSNPLFEQVMIIGEGRRFLAALLVLEKKQWSVLAAQLYVDPEVPEVLQSAAVKRAVLQQVAECIKAFPGYAQIRALYIMLDPWTVGNGLLTPTLKLKRPKVLERYQAQIEALYLEMEKDYSANKNQV